jgi:hypothetical protein
VLAREQQEYRAFVNSGYNRDWEAAFARQSVVTAHGMLIACRLTTRGFGPAGVANLCRRVAVPRI